MATSKPTNLTAFLNPGTTSPGVSDPTATTAPSVYDEKGDVVAYDGLNKITTEKTVVDLGDSPNSNTGDPLRLAFIKINNFMEASYQVNRVIDSEIQVLSTVIDGGFF